MRWTLLLSSLIFCLHTQAAEPVVDPINLLADGSLETFPAFLNPKLSATADANEAFIFTEDGQLHVTGKGWGYLRTKETYRDYHMVVEFKWGEHTFGARADKARDCGVFIHAGETDQIIGKSWPRAIEVQLLQGASGNLSFLGHRGAAWEANDQAGDRFKVTNRVFPESFEDVKGFRNPNAIEQPMGSWNRLEVIAKGDTLEVRLNGQPVNSATGLSTSEGQVGIQTELAECWIRRWELLKTGAQLPKWAPGSVSTDTGYSPDGESILPREFPLSPEESLAAWEIDGDYELQLVAAEPLVCDPVDVAWDAQGRMFVAEMGDYPLPPEGGATLSRIRLLKDTNGDGVMDEAVTWAGEMDHVQGLLPLRDGLLATTRTAILFLRDTTGDDRADEITTLFTSNEPNHNQLQISSPRWGLDHAIYLNNGLDGKEIYPEGNPEAKLAFAGKNLRYDPRTESLTTTVGRGQFGATFDDWGRRYFCSNRNPAIMEVMPLAALENNPFAGLTKGHADIANNGGVVPVYPLQLSHTTANAHAGTHTAACGMAIYRGRLMPELSGDLLVCEPTGQLIVRYDMIPDGAAMKAERMGENRDFLASRDEWSRPVNLRNGPDGALYICDMYRRFVDHARFFPEEFSKSHYMRAGVDQGRIYRMVSKGEPKSGMTPLPTTEDGLRKELSSTHAWRRIHAQRLLTEKGFDETAMQEDFQSSKSPLARLHAFHLLASQGSLTPEIISTAIASDSPALQEAAIPFTQNEQALVKLIANGKHRVPFLASLQLSGNDSQTVTNAFCAAIAGSDDPWLRDAILSSSESGDRMMQLTLALIEAKKKNLESIQVLAKAVAKKGSSKDLTRITEAIGKTNPVEAWQLALVTGLLEGRLPKGFESESIDQIVDQAASTLASREASDSDRIAAIPLAKRQPTSDGFLKLAEPIITSPESPVLQTAVFQALATIDRNAVAEYLLSAWERLAPASKREAITLITSKPDPTITLLKKMKQGEINPTFVDTMTRWRLSRSTNEEIKTLATELFGRSNSDRAAVVADYREELTTSEGDPVRGREVFQTAACFTCHKKDDLGMEVGPNLADVKIKPAEALLTDILDPNRAVEGRWSAYTIELKDGQTVSGLVATETGQTVDLVMPGGAKMSIARSDIANIDTVGHSLMPEGLEAAISKEAMRDLIAFLKQ